MRTNSFHLCVLVDLFLVLIPQVLHQPLHMAKFCLQPQFLLGHCVQLLMMFTDVVLEHVFHITASCFWLLPKSPLGLHNLIWPFYALHLINEGSKLIVKAPDLLLPSDAQGLDVGVPLQLQGDQQIWFICTAVMLPIFPTQPLPSARFMLAGRPTW